MSDLTWVIVCFGNVDDAASMINSLGGPGAADFVVVDNAPTLTRSGIDFNQGDSISVVHYPDNPGYLGAFDRITATIRDRDLVLSNADLHGDAHTVGLMSQRLAESDALMIAPRVRTLDGVDQNPYYKRRPTQRQLRRALWMLRYPSLGRTVRGLKAVARPSKPKAEADEPEQIWGGHGSVLIFSSRFWAEGGSAAYPCTLFAEEIWCGAEVERLGGTVAYEPRVALTHREHATTGQERTRRGAIARWQLESCRYWLDIAKQRGW